MTKERLRQIVEERKRSERTPETDRILNLPVMPEDRVAEAPDLTECFLLPGAKAKLRPVQSAALFELAETGTLFGNIGVGHGKFLISRLAPAVLDSKRPLLVTKADLLRQTHIEVERWSKVFDLPDMTTLSYERLSMPENSELLDELAPDLIVCDEAHSLRHRTSARTRRVLRYMVNNPSTYFIPLSGTMTRKGLNEYAHILELALRDGSPVPLDYFEFNAWAASVDVDGEPDKAAKKLMSRVVTAFPSPSVRESFQRRLRSAPGVVTTERQSCDVSLYMREHPLNVPATVEKELQDMEETWCTPDGEEIAEAFTLARLRRSLLCGFYYKWEWPGGEPDMEWLQNRRKWAKQVRRVLKQARAGRDSPHLVQRYAQRPGCKDKLLVQAWADWLAVSDRPVPPVKTVWVDKYLIDRVVGLLKRQRTPTLVWAEHRAVFEALVERGLHGVGPGDEIPSKPIDCVISRRSHGTGKNLQAWNNSIITSFIPDGSALEQLLGRTHRPGQAADEVTYHYFNHHDVVSADVEKAKAQCTYIEQTHGTLTKVLAATWVDTQMYPR